MDSAANNITALIFPIGLANIVAITTIDISILLLIIIYKWQHHLSHPFDQRIQSHVGSLICSSKIIKRCACTSCFLIVLYIVILVLFDVIFVFQCLQLGTPEMFCTGFSWTFISLTFILYSVFVMIAWLIVCFRGIIWRYLRCYCRRNNSITPPRTASPNVSNVPEVRNHSFTEENEVYNSEDFDSDIQGLHSGGRGSRMPLLPLEQDSDFLPTLLDPLSPDKVVHSVSAKLIPPNAIPVDAIPSDIGLKETLEMLPNWQKYAIHLGLSIERVEYYRGLQEMNMGGLLALKHWRDGKCGSDYPSTWKFLISVIEGCLGPNVAKDLKTKVIANKLWTCTSQSDSLESLPQGLGSGIPIPLLTQDSAPLSSSLEQESQELVGYGYINLEHESSDQGAHDGYYCEPSKPLTVQHLMPYINDLADEVVSISGWLDMDRELEVIKRTPGVINPKEQLQELLKKWLEDTERPNAPHTWEYFVRVVREVRKGHVVERIVGDVFTGEVSSISNDAIPTWVEKMADNWITFGIALGFSEEYLQSISDLNDNDVARCSAMMYHWLRTGDRREKTHERLLRAAKEATSGRCTEPLTYLEHQAVNVPHYELQT